MSVLRRHRLVPAAVVAAAVFALLAAGCGGGGSSGTAGWSALTNAPTTTTQNGTPASALAFARCMRSHGIPNWPDPNSRGLFDKSKLQQLGLSVSHVRALEEGPCNIPLPGARGYTITPADRADYLEAAACMRTHGFPDFPDPTFRDDNVQTNIPSSISQDSSRFKSAAETCTRLIPAGLPYSRSSRS
jgi:hypothetical protein